MYGKVLFPNKVSISARRVVLEPAMRNFVVFFFLLLGQGPRYLKLALDLLYVAKYDSELLILLPQPPKC